MKNILFILLSLVLAVNVSSAQDYKKLLKKASKNLGKYNLDPAGNADKLDEALAQVDEAFSTEEAKSSAKAWLTKGKIFNELAAVGINAKIIDPSATLNNADAAQVAFDALTKACSMAEKKGTKKDALKALAETEGHLYNTGIFMYQDQSWENAFTNFDKQISAYKLLNDAGEESRLDDPSAMKDQLLTTAVTGYYAEKYDAIAPYLDQMYKAGDADPFVYEALYKSTKETDAAAALKYLEEGRSAHADDQGLMFAEINHYLQAGEIEGLVSKLEKAAEMEPDNESVQVTLGSVYDQLSVAKGEAGDAAAQADYFAKAKATYESVIAKNPANFDATYSVGALYYNKAAAMTESLNALANDFSKAGTAKYNDIKKQMDDLFNQALPLFLEAEKLNPQDGNTLLALKEIYARNNDLEKSAAYKAKFEASQN